MASLLQRIERIEQARAQAAEKAQARHLDPTARRVRLSQLYALADHTDLQADRRMRALRVVALLDSAANRAGHPRLSAAVPAPLRIVNSSTTTSTKPPPTGPTSIDVRAQLERQAQWRDAEAFHRLTN